MPKTKIIATLGPASSSAAVLRRMMQAGLDVVRLNFSHGTLREKIPLIRTVRLLNRKMRRRIRILGDLEGYRLRIGDLARPIELRRNQTVYLIAVRDASLALAEAVKGADAVIPFDYTGDLSRIHNGHEIFIDDGNLALVAEARLGVMLKARVIQGGLLKEHKGINIPGARFDFKGLTVKDREDIDFCAAHKLDFIAQSFVRTKADILDVRRAMGNAGMRVIAKIENKEGIRNLSGIMEVSDGVIIARGDLGVSLPIYQVPFLQKEIIRRCVKSGVFSVTATQMLESMTANLRPTRAEVSDVANAIIDGSDYLMLSAETAVGEHPAEAVAMMNQIIVFTEKHLKSVRAIGGRV